MGSLVVAWLAELLFAKVAGKLAEKTATKLDDQLVVIVRRPIFLSVLFYGLNWATSMVELPARIGDPLTALLQTLVILTWALAGGRVGGSILAVLAEREREGSLLQPSSLAIFDVLMRLSVASAAAYFMFLAWEVDLTAWLASAGIVGVALGFAAKDPLSDTAAGILILAYGPYELHDWIMLDNKLRGEVTHIGLRTTRILTPEDVEIFVRNSVIGNSKITNESRGRHRRQRVRVGFKVAYGNDVKQVRELIVAAARGAPHILEQPEDAAPKVRLLRLGRRGLEFELSVWIEDPKVREPVIDEMTTRIYEALVKVGIEIPMAKYDVRIRQGAARLPSA
ncbi:MAG: mechanosensitive ion channel family protein [Enhygromyxa sp.]